MLSNVVSLDAARRRRWAQAPRVTKPGPAVESDGTRWQVLEVWPQAGSALCVRPGYRASLPLTWLREAK